MENQETYSFQYAFYSSSTSSQTLNPVVFGEKMMGNENGDYKADSGKFIVPKTGTYFFGVQFQDLVKTVIYRN